jgi:hypothetical protein
MGSHRLCEALNGTQLFGITNLVISRTTLWQSTIHHHQPKANSVCILEYAILWLRKELDRKYSQLYLCSSRRAFAMTIFTLRNMSIRRLPLKRRNAHLPCMRNALIPTGRGYSCKASKRWDMNSMVKRIYNRKTIVNNENFKCSSWTSTR